MASAVAQEGPRDDSAAATAATGSGPERVEVERALEALLGVPVSLAFKEKAGQLTLHFRTVSDVEALLRTLLAARTTQASGAATSAEPPAPWAPGTPDLRLVTTGPPDDGRRARAARGRGKARNVAAYGPRPAPVRQ